MRSAAGVIVLHPRREFNCQHLLTATEAAPGNESTPHRASIAPKTCSNRDRIVKPPSRPDTILGAARVDTRSTETGARPCSVQPNNAPRPGAAANGVLSSPRAPALRQCAAASVSIARQVPSFGASRRDAVAGPRPARRVARSGQPRCVATVAQHRRRVGSDGRRQRYPIRSAKTRASTSPQLRDGWQAARRSPRHRRADRIRPGSRCPGAPPRAPCRRQRCRRRACNPRRQQRRRPDDRLDSPVSWASRGSIPRRIGKFRPPRR